MGASSENGVLTRPFILRQCLGGDLQFMVAIVWACGVLSQLSIFNLAMVFGSTNESVAWPSILASPSTDRSYLGYIRITGHVRLNNCVNSVCP